MWGKLNAIDQCTHTTSLLSVHQSMYTKRQYIHLYIHQSEVSTCQNSQSPVLCYHDSANNYYFWLQTWTLPTITISEYKHWLCLNRTVTTKIQIDTRQPDIPCKTAHKTMVPVKFPLAQGYMFYKNSSRVNSLTKWVPNSLHHILGRQDNEEYYFSCLFLRDWDIGPQPTMSSPSMSPPLAGPSVSSWY